MTKEQYRKLSLTPEWKNRRSYILKRDDNKCRKCSCKSNLHVHHIWYIQGRLPWEVPDSYLITLCEDCHNKEHKDRNITSFVKKSKNIKSVPQKLVHRKIRLMILSCISSEEKKLVRSKGLQFSEDIFKLQGMDPLREKLKEKLKDVKNKLYDNLKKIVNSN